MIYMDTAATTKPYPEVIKAMNEVLEIHWANPSSNNSLADEPRRLIENVRQLFADDLNCTHNEIIFTGSGCESNTLAIEGFLDVRSGYDFYYSNLEHSSINELANKFHNSVIVPNDNYGIIGAATLNASILNQMKKSGNIPFVSITAASSEIGMINNIKSLAKVVHEYGGIIHCDAVQLFPEQRIDVQDWGVDMLSISAQKFHGPRGCGILFVRNGIELKPVIYGSQENHLRGGSYNTAAIAGAGMALVLAREHNSLKNVQRLRDKLLSGLLQIPDVMLNGPYISDKRLANNISLTVDGVNAEKLMTLCDICGLIIARGYACQSHVPTPSRALLAIGLTPEQALNTIRITLDELTTEEEIEQAINIITTLIERIRNED
jgi:cysteine desulfurase